MTIDDKRKRPAYWSRIASDHARYAAQWSALVDEAIRDRNYSPDVDGVEHRERKVAEHEGKSAGYVFRMLEMAYDMGVRDGSKGKDLLT